MDLIFWLFFMILYRILKKCKLITLTDHKKGFTNVNMDYKIVTSIIRWYKLFQFWKQN